MAASAAFLTGMASPINLDTHNVPDDVKQAVSRLPTAQVSSLGKDHIPTVVEGYLGRIAGPPDAMKLRAALPDILAAFRLKVDDLKLERCETDGLGMIHYRFEQNLNGLPVAGANFAVHIDGKSGRICSANGNARSVQMTSTPKIDQSTAEKKALETTKDVAIDGQTELMYVVSTKDGSLHLAFRVELVGTKGDPLDDLVFIDALDGSFVARHPQIMESRDRNTYTAGNGWGLPGTLVRNESSGPCGDNVVNDAHDNLGIVYNFYSNVFGRDSMDAAGMTIKTSVHFGSAYDNSYWDNYRHQLVFGDGDGTVFSPLGSALDCAGHEFTHGVTYYSSRLIYSGESGGLNEAMSDIMGAMCEAWNNGGISSATWMMFEDVWTPNISGDACRYMNDPAADGYSLDYYPDYYDGVDVHYSSGIANLAFKLFVTGGTHPRSKTTVNVPGIGAAKAEQIFYRVNSYYAGQSTTFPDFRTYTEQAASDLYGSPENYAAKAAWAAVGVGSPPEITPQATVTPLQPSFGQTITLTQAGTAEAGIAWTENVVWQPNGQPDVLGNKGLGTITYMPHAGPGTYWYQFRVVDNYYNYEDEWISFTVQAPSGSYLIPATWVSPAVPISSGNSVILYPYGMASAGVAWTENVIWPPNSSPVVLGNLSVGGAYGYTPTAGPGTYWYQFRLVDNNINYVDQWSYFFVTP